MGLRVRPVHSANLHNHVRTKSQFLFWGPAAQVVIRASEDRLTEDAVLQAGRAAGTKRPRTALR